MVRETKTIVSYGRYINHTKVGKMAPRQEAGKYLAWLERLVDMLWLQHLDSG